MFAKSIYPIISINTINNINSQPKFMIKPSNEEIILVASILLETLSTACLKNLK